MITIVAKNINNKLKYTIDYIFSQRLGLNYKIIDGTTTSNNLDNTIYYTDKQEINTFSIYKTDFLYKTKIDNTIPEIRKENEQIYLFPSNDERYKIKFDIFSAIFYELSRYEEYLDYEKDIHGRFDTKQSLAFKNNFHQRAIVDEWIYDFGKTIKENFPNENVKFDKFSYQVTVDVDIAYSFLHKGLTRFCGGAIRDILKLDFKNFLDRFSTLLRIKKDPFYTFDFLQEAEKELKTPLQYFILVAKNKTKYDKNNNRHNSKFAKLIKELCKNDNIGLHPSYYSNKDTETLLDEKRALEQISGKEINKSRQHYLRMNLPETYEKLINTGFTDDYTMGFAENFGYRAGTSRPYKFFNLRTDKEENLTIHPFSIMDGSLKDYQNIDNEGVKQIFSEHISYLKQFGGKFTLLMHNETMSESKRWKGWREIFKKLIEELNANCDD